MTALPSPVREPAWSLSRSAIGLWVTESVISSLVLGIGAAAVVLFLPPEPGTPLPALRWLVPIAALLYAASTCICTPTSLSQDVGLGLGAQAGEQRLRQVFEAAGFARFQRVAETPTNLIFQAKVA